MLIIILKETKNKLFFKHGIIDYYYTNNMGVSISRTQIDIYNRKRVEYGRGSILIIGLDNAGKSLIVGQLTKGGFINTKPTMGYEKTSFNHFGQKWDIFDVRGSVLVRETWRLCSQAADGIIVVVDSTDMDRIKEIQYQLRRLYYGEDATGSNQICKAPLLVLANK